ncbi:NAD(+)/NADH kinase [Desulfopila sp. IMCC35006]|uniref:NAD(+)/NADH kinase n=1 Tax=Desulfopila sp. IMCC35006 TaxID=2569542 RepID=UPI0010ABB562|nr:NAD(+)/NADH kinase [Desulfopila sp. IMCC35006]TKB27632.1 NAD(+)/NADH kinase [Desulfopila sp. IMCC35006]
MTGKKTVFRTETSLVISTVGIITKLDDARSDSYAATLSDWLQQRNIVVYLNEITPRLDIIIVLGGDGTLLHIAEKAARHAIPVLGINLGNLGFLTELTEKETFQALERILAGELTIENRLMLKARLIAKDQVTDYRYALNDVVITKNVLDRLLRLSTKADDEYITTYKADGLIFSSPTGSTAYNLSAGGPLVYPGLATITVTPICPFMLSSRPIILPADKRIRTRFDAGRGAERAQIIIDGQAFWEMRDGDELEIETAGQTLQLIVSSTRDYFTILRNKLHWGVSGERS